MSEQPSLNRPALMYPNIHVKDKNWLKATLLCFPRVLRMHPQAFKPQDYDLVGEFVNTRNQDGLSLLGSEYINVLDRQGHSPAYDAQQMLRHELEDNLDYIRRRYAPTDNKFLGGVEPYEIHTEKLEPPFFEFLLSNNLAYSIQGRDYYDQTVCLHPALGDAIMTVTAISVANAKGYDIVTDDTNYHLAVSALNARAVLQQLLRRLPERSSSDSKAEKADELAQVVISTQFDVGAMTPERIVELNHSPDFIAFKDALVPLVSREPSMDSPAARQERYEVLARDVIKKWESTRALFSWQTAKAVAETAQISAPNFTSKLVAAGLATWISQPVGQAIFVGVLGIKSRQIYKEWREGQTAFRYLTRLEKAGALLVGGPLGAFAGNPEYGSRVQA